MAGRSRRSGVSASQWQAQQRALQRAQEQAARKAEQERKAAEKASLARHQQSMADRAERQTRALETRVTELNGLLAASLTHSVRFDLAELKKTVVVPPLDLGADALALRPPLWEHFAPASPGPISRIFGGQQRYDAAYQQATAAFTNAQAAHTQAEIARQHRVTAAQLAHKRQVRELQQSTAKHNAAVEDIRRRFAVGERRAVSDYFQHVLQRSRYPQHFPTLRRAGYVPESKLLAIEWELPTTDIVPADRAFKYLKNRDVIESTKRPRAEMTPLYQRLVAQVALRTLHEVFEGDATGLVDTIVFNGIVNSIDRTTGKPVTPCLITLRATKERFSGLVLAQVDPVACIRKYFFAEVSKHPDELEPVTPVMDFDMADPRIIDPVDVMSGLDPRPNLLELTAKEFEGFVQNLFAKMGLDTKLFRANGDGGVDCIAYDPHPILGGKFVIQAKLYTKTVSPTHIRDLYGTAQHEGATKGILITTSGYGPSSYEFANGKPLQLIDGSGLLALCHQHDIAARIVHVDNSGKRINR